jgi:hypothetical protein
MLAFGRNVCSFIFKGSKHKVMGLEVLKMKAKYSFKVSGTTQQTMLSYIPEDRLHSFTSL